MHSEGKRITINLGYALLGEELEIHRELHIEIEEGVIVHIGRGFFDKADFDLKHGIAIPALINSHIHILDYAFPEYGTTTLRLPEVVAEPHGIKHKLLAELTTNDVIYSCKEVFSKLLASGVTSALIFVELPTAVSLVHKIAAEYGIKAIVLGRPRGNIKVEDFIDEAHGLGLDSPLRYDVQELTKMNSLCRQKHKIIATHIAESINAYAKGDFKLALDYLDADIIVHGTNLKKEDIKTIAEKNKTIVVCPRSNMWFGVGIPPLREFLEHNVNILLGTDNAGLIEPDIWREMETVYNILRLSGVAVNAKEILKMVTTNITKIKMLGINNIIDEGKKTNFIILDSQKLGLSRSKDIYASIVKRGSPTCIINVFTTKTT